LLLAFWLFVHRIALVVFGGFLALFAAMIVIVILSVAASVLFFTIFIVRASTAVLHGSKVLLGLSEVEIVLESLNVVQIIEIHGDLHRLFNSFDFLIQLLIFLFIVSISLGFRALARLKGIEEGFGSDRLDDLSGFAGLLVLLLLLDLFLGEILSIFPVDEAAFSFFNFLILVLLKGHLQGQLLVGEPLVFREGQLDCDRLFGQESFHSGHVGQVGNNFAIFLTDVLEHDLVV